MMNKVLTIMMSLILILSFMGCSQSKDGAKTAIKEEPKETEEATPTTTQVTTATEPAVVPEVPTATAAPDPDAPRVTAFGERVYRVTYPSKILKQAIDGSNHEKELIIYLPKSYETSEKSYPVVYYFHGFGESPMYVFTSSGNFDTFMLPDQEFIVVGVDCNTTAGSGSYFANSEVIGNWDDFMIKEIIPYIDGNYRTIPDVNSRACMGFSMGGYIALKMAFLHPDLFSSTLAVAPGVLRDDQLDVAMKSWQGDNTFLKAYGRAFAPNTEKEDLCDIPTLDGSEEDNIICDKWLNGFGHLEEKVDNYLALNQSLKGIQIIYGNRDSYAWIPTGCQYLSELMTERGIDHTLTEVAGGHSIPNNFIKDYVIPFYSNTLSFTH